MNDNPPVTKRQVRSFVLREGRMTEGQKKAYAEQWPQHGISIGEQIINAHELFGNDHPLILEIGFGNGDSLIETAKNNPQNNYIGIEVHRPGVGRLLANIDQLGLTNLKAIRHDAIEVMQNNLADQSLNGICLFFADPWPKTKHKKRRIVQGSFADLCQQKLKPGGYLHMATDWQDYARHMLKIMEPRSDFSNTAGTGEFSPRPDHRPLTKFETRGHKLGHGVWDLIYLRR